MDIERAGKTREQHTGRDQREMGSSTSVAGIRPVRIAAANTGGMGRPVWQGGSIYVAGGAVIPNRQCIVTKTRARRFRATTKKGINEMMTNANEDMKTYTYSNGLTITPRSQPCGVFYAMGETHIEEEKVFDVRQHGKFLATAETWDQAKGMVFDILSNATGERPETRSERKR